MPSCPSLQQPCPRRPIIAVDMVFAYRWIWMKSDDRNLATKMRRINFVAVMADIESKNDSARTPEGLI
ncbi:hypothetical protein CkaCkLH20_13025 [Colletotrichum karsti]|uniref:Uncharacterized protein n=1 Tax=Colletotrichum karsti TaxID=1095194 RepID=A0A9P6HS08_9PEZI|nr:uncharacterized protein CkaCkLH20_13025 [Colletotrichum karsti]KAF9869487.1 hypothetical protein CkaCkLH20_13025 [Colletotrichum karsti]